MKISSKNFVKVLKNQDAFLKYIEDVKKTQEI